MVNSVSISPEDQTLAAGYVLGDLSPEELEDFEYRLHQNLALRREVRSLQATLRLMPQAIPPVAPPPHLQEQIFAAVLDAIAVEPALPASRGFSRLKWRRGIALPWAKLVTGIAVLIAVLLAIDNTRLRYRLSAEQPIDPEDVAAILQRPNSRLVALSGNNIPAAGTVLFTPGQWQQVIVSIGDLPPLPPDQVYRMWLSLDNGQIIPCGEFNPDQVGDVFVELSALESLPEGSRATGVFVTVASESEPLIPQGTPVMFGGI